MSGPFRLEMQRIAKSFGPTQALGGVDLSIRPGEIHALVGENGAGKSTLMKILSGAERADAGSMILDGMPFTPRDPHDARKAGVAMVYQELTLAPHLSVEANILLGQESSRFGVLQNDRNRQRVERALKLLEHPEILPDMPVAELNPAACQLVEIARALLADVKVLVLDEPTSALTRADAERLFALVRRLKERGVAIVYISHYLEEIETIGDRFTVLRDGQNAGGGDVKAVARERIIEQMVGRKLDEQYPRVPHTIGEPVLSLDSVNGLKLPSGVSLSLRRGEILGIAGIIGAGRTELLRAIFGLDAVKSGRIVVKTFSSAATPRARIAQGIGLLSEDRKLEGLALDQSIADNLTYSWLRPYSRFGLINLAKRSTAAGAWLRKLNVRCRDAGQTVGELSGGNQQKVALGRLLHQQADVLLLDEPTRGVDVASKAEIYRLIGELAAQGKAILFVSSYLPELLGACDTLAVMFRGFMSPVRPAAEWNAEQVMAYATGSQTSERV
jgi:ribose transport system ATP-binding protein